MVSPSAIETIVAELGQALPLQAIWLFGSEAEGRARVDSDVDIAVLVDGRIDPLTLLDARERLASRLGRDVDLVELRHASPILAMQVLKHGRLIREADRRARIAFEAALPGRYEDVQRMRAPLVRALVARTLHGRA